MPNRISRSRFLRDTSLSVASFAFLPSFLSTALSDESSLFIVLPEAATDTDNRAAKILSESLPKIQPAPVSVISEPAYRSGRALFLGNTLHAQKTGLRAAAVPKDGYKLQANQDRIIIFGQGEGTLYGVYDLLESAGFQYYSPKGVFVPGKATLPEKKISKTVSPLIHYRSTSYGEMSTDYASWHKLSSRSEWGLFVHTFHTLVPPADYGVSHPEYYSLINGVRQPATQLCLSNDAVLTTLAENLKKEIAAKPGAIYWSVSQNDNDQYCQCNNCKALNAQYGDVPSGSILWFVNRVARAFPDKTISTLAYWYSRRAPRNIQAEANVNIMLCNIESRRQAPVYETDPAFTKDLVDWGGIAKDILLWDYNIQFTNYFGPFPNLHTLGPNIRFYLKNNVRALFMQANSEPAAEMALLRGYMISKLMWDPVLDDKAVMQEFLDGYFGAAGIFLAKYIERMQTALKQDNFKLNIFGDPVDAKDNYLSEENMNAYSALFDKAEQAVATKEVMLQRIQTARLPLLYATIQIGRTQFDTTRSLYYKSATGMPAVKPEAIALVSKFVSGCVKEKVKLVRERAGSPEHFQAAYERIFTLMADNAKSLSYAKKIDPVTAVAAASKPASALTDGLFGSYEAWQDTDRNFIFYTGQHADFVLDLGAVSSLHSINMDFLNPQAQPDWHLMALPRYVSYALSEDGKVFGPEVKIENPYNTDPVANPEISKVSVCPFTAPVAGKNARFIRVHAENILKAPSWHIRAGQPVSIYTDQIVVM